MKIIRALALSLLVCVAGFAQNAALMPVAKQQFFDQNGKPLAGGYLYTCVAGSTCAVTTVGQPPSNPQATYTDSTGGTQAPNPIVLDAAGRAAIWIGSSPLKVVATNYAGVQQWTADNVTNNGFGVEKLQCVPNGIACLDSNGFVPQSNLNYILNTANAGAGPVNRTIQTKFQDVVSVKDYGAVGDGVTDDTAALLKALRSADAYYNTEFSASNGRKIIVPPGAYLISSPLYLRKGDTLECAGGTGSAILTTSTFASGAMLYLGFKSDGTQDPGGLAPVVEGCFLSSSSANAVVGIQSYIGTNYISGFRIENNWFTVNTGVALKGTDGLVRGNMFDNSITGAYVLGDGTRYGVTHNIQLQNNAFYAPAYACVLIDGASDVTVSGNYCSYAKFRGIYFANTGSGGTSYRIKMDGNTFTTSSSASYYDPSQTDIDISYPLEDSEISNNHFSRSRAQSVLVNNAAILNLSLTGNKYQDTNGTAVTLSAAGGPVKFSGETFRNLGNYAIDDASVPVLIQNNYCSSIFLVAGVPSNAYDQACFRLLNAGVSGSVISGNVTDSTSYGIATMRSGATGVSTYSNQSQWATADVYWYGSSANSGKSWNERVSNSGGVVLTGPTNSLNLAAGNAFSRIAQYAASITPAATSAATCTEQVFSTFTGVLATDLVAGVSGPANTGGIAQPQARIAGANTIGLTWCNPTAAAITAPSGTYSVLVYH